ncbi:MAG: lipoprotein insertase outer membrane protein LolB [Gammaproteobacteria bacterium]|nr:lipoprotein insertase outer membrane protein LolB [Gammaproteobacteria bacterium]MBU1488329.1 lipoprotein insertase outer membrane protein LolB [Gammaproteobacteria bacterium]MBU2066039.1 lipoprotein insertase outer membrane protein LolB [Gammaproteobacteria bacterium]MBU2138459.1 lipoprotein insertase outer membrane protein LolB [Gammaproteobacteria bacterium]MBU2215389.1 lipoprotein insertase outer membrane protein LolB [Gammaproteobacteria bacterium]
MMIRHLIAFGLILLLAGCAGFGERESLEGEGSPALWQAHKAQVSQLDGWQINGKVGIRAPRDSGSGTLFWLQRQAYSDIRLSGPLGRGAARLTGRPGDITLEVANQGRYQAESPEELLQQQLGLNLPVSHLLWWIRGLPAPDSRSRLALDGDSRLARLAQDGWDVEYLRYVEQDGYWLPERLRLTGHDLQVTLVIKDWQPRQLGH